ncbi:gamma-tubulin complex component 5-like isoform X2 [Dysidea avara]|uniref:gamma-tubulin complex component 5-like isoform X2 n=1 Tax=Dysidea avara TaxID=196820 RepID=UPI00332DAA69
MMSFQTGAMMKMMMLMEMLTDLLSRVPAGTDTISDDDDDDDDDPASWDRDGKVAMTASMMWLRDHLIPLYWSSQYRDGVVVGDQPSAAANRYCTLVNDWTAYAKGIGHSDVKEDMVTMTEFQVVRETIWLLVGVRSSFVYNYCEDDGSVTPNSTLQVTHLTPGALRQLLLRFCEAATILCHLREFVDEVLMSSRGEGGCYVTCQTYQAFAGCLHDYLKEFHSTLLGIEKNLVSNNEFVSLSQLEYKLHAKIIEQRVLYHVHTKGILTKCDDPAQCVCHLLDAIWRELLYYDCAGHQSAVHEVLLVLWLKTVRPYLEILGNWITSGILYDYHDEICIKIIDVGPDTHRMWSDKVEIRTSKTDNSKLVPAFLAPVIEKTVLAGKSMEIAKDLVKANPTVPSECSSDLYSELTQSLHSVSYDTRADQLDGTQSSLQSPLQLLTVKTDPKGVTSPSSVTEVPPIMEVWGVDSLMDQFFKSIYPDNSTETSVQRSTHSMSDLSLDNIITTNPMVPVSQTIQNCLLPIICRKCAHAGSLLVELIKSNYHLEDHFKHIQLIFLMEAGDVIHQFCEEIFHRISIGEVWQESFVLDTILYEAMQPCHPDLEKYIRTSLKELPVASTTTLSIHAMTALTLCYKVPWPVDSIIDSDSLKIYNRVFQFLMQVKWAKWNLEECKCRAVNLLDLSADQAANVHHMHLLRARMLHFVINLNNYLMTRILHSVGIEFEKSISKAKDFSEIIELHKEYVTKIHDRCLLNEKASYVKEAILRILGLALSFGKKWRQALTTTTSREIDSINSEFTKCTHFLVTLLNKVIKRGSFPHLESLAFSIASLEVGIHKQTIQL